MESQNRKKHRTAPVVAIRQSLRQAVALAAAFLLVAAPLAWADRTQLKPGWNMYSAQQDVEVGQQVAKDVDKKVPMLNDSRVDNYLNNLGQRLAAHAPGYKFPYSYKTVNDRAINAFALPGGHVYINRGVIEIADDEAQLAGVMAHETSHVALRHGTNQASKASTAQIPLAILGGLLGNNSVGASLAQLGAGFTLNSILLKYSRTDESQADIMGTQILYDSGYDPRGMTQFLEKLQALDKGGHHIEFFASHPSPDRRVERTGEEVDKLGGPPRGAKTDSSEFQQIKRYVKALPAPRGTGQGSQAGLQGGSGGNTGGNNGGSGNGASQTTGRLQILTASYGAKDEFVDVRQRLQSSVQNDRLDLQVSNETMGGDPLRNYAKTLRITYEWAGKRHNLAIPENQQLFIPTDQDQVESGVQNKPQTGSPSDQMKTFENSILRIDYPDNWQAYGQGDAATIAPRGGLIDDGNGNQALALGVLVNMYQPHTDTPVQQLAPRGYGDNSGQNSAQNSSAHARLEQDTDQLVTEFRLSNRNMRVVRYHEDIRVDGQDAVSTYLSNDSPAAGKGRETDWLITFERPDGLVFIIFTAPEHEFQNYEYTFQQMLYSVRLAR